MRIKSRLNLRVHLTRIRGTCVANGCFVVYTRTATLKCLECKQNVDRNAAFKRTNKKTALPACFFLIYRSRKSRKQGTVSLLPRHGTCYPFCSSALGITGVPNSTCHVLWCSQHWRYFDFQLTEVEIACGELYCRPAIALLFKQLRQRCRSRDGDN